ncbi:hypothetical protein GGTG_01952 [Gaeumannomyces tritici R3-111a-1]|uniref:Uncharacterized protein n=1 Tax=Gaeumannomyces tritici (strain R3-111a-1) TaxID=644352 RepID=J3NL11_GAET3|nr:hypothetical protein GGTG_01952 [Gaeumannomyces tritici R3-111a-1]EJT81978.1 hypothetical protein GGTG_01952 [Gaeumannomyces tritici R3-111a-1]
MKRATKRLNFGFIADSAPGLAVFFRHDRVVPRGPSVKPPRPPLDCLPHGHAHGHNHGHGQVNGQRAAATAERNGLPAVHVTHQLSRARSSGVPRLHDWVVMHNVVPSIRAHPTEPTFRFLVFCPSPTEKPPSTNRERRAETDRRRHGTFARLTAPSLQGRPLLSSFWISGMPANHAPFAFAPPTATPHPSPITNPAHQPPSRSSFGQQSRNLYARLVPAQLYPVPPRDGFVPVQTGEHRARAQAHRRPTPACIPPCPILPPTL